MSTQTPGFWSRLADSLKRKSRTDDLPEIGEDGLLVSGAEDEAEGKDAEKSAGSLSRWSRRDQNVAQLQEGYERVTGLIEEIQKHLAIQGERSERICGSLEQLARSVSDQPTISRQQAQSLEAIVTQLEKSNERTKQLAEGVQEMPKLARAQHETLSGLKRQLDMAGEQSVLSSRTMEKVGIALTTLGEANSTQTQVLNHMNDRSAEHGDLLMQMLRKQSKRFTMLFVVTIVLAVVAVGAAVTGIVLSAHAASGG